MNHKLHAILLIGMFLISSFTTSSTIGDEITTSSNKNQTKSCGESKDYQKPEFWGVLVGSDPFEDYVGEKAIENVQNIKQILCDGGWKENHLQILKDNVTKKDVFQALSWLEKNAKATDTVLIYLRDHGSYGSFSLRDGRLWYRLLDKKLNRINYAGMAVIISACYSGSAIKFLQRDKRVILTSCDEDEKGGFESLSLEMGLKGFADINKEFGNKNGFVSAEELFEYCIAEDFQNPDYPGRSRIQDNYEGQLSLTFHNWTEEKVDQVTDHLTNGRCAVKIGDDGQKQIAQSFIPKYSKLTKVELFVINYYLENAYPIKLTIRKELDGENLSSRIVVPDGLANMSTSKLLTFDFPDIDVTPGETYYIVCSSLAEKDEHGSSYEILGNNNCYESGNLYISYNGGERWRLDLEEWDICFITYGKNNQSKNHTPYSPHRPVGSSFGKKNIDYTYYTSSEDYEGDQIYYEFDWGDGNPINKLGPYESGEVVCASHNWRKKGTYYVKVRTKEGYTNRVTDWSDSLRVDISRCRFGIKIEERLIDFPYLSYLYDWLFNS